MSHAPNGAVLDAHKVAVGKAGILFLLPPPRASTATLAISNQVAPLANTVTSETLIRSSPTLRLRRSG